MTENHENSENPGNSKLTDPWSVRSDEMQEFETKWLASLPAKLRKIVDLHHLTPFNKYAIDTYPDRASYFRVFSINHCDCESGHHITLMTFTHAGMPYCFLGNVTAEALVEYPYSPTNPPPADKLEEQKRVLARISSGKQVVLTMAGILPLADEDMFDNHQLSKLVERLEAERTTQLEHGNFKGKEKEH